MMNPFSGGLPGEDLIFSWYTIAIALSVGMIFGLRSYMRGPSVRSDVMIKKKVVVITGASSGIGLEVAKELAGRGGRIVLTCRNEESGEKAVQEVIEVSTNKRVECMKLDLNSTQSIYDFVEAFESKYDRLDILVNNAGTMYNPEAKTAEGVEMHFATNYLGHFLLTHLLLDTIKGSESARIINISCPAYQLAEPDFTDINCENKEHKPSEAFALSKLAVMLFTKEMARRLEGTGVTCNIVHPGICYTDIYRNMPFMKSKIIGLTFKPLLWFLMKGARDGAQTIIHAAVAKEEEGVSGKMYTDLQIVQPDAKVEDLEAAERLWKVSLEMSGVKEESS